VGGALCIPVIGKQIMQDPLGGITKTEKQQHQGCKKTSYVIGLIQ